MIFLSETHKIRDYFSSKSDIDEAIPAIKIIQFLTFEALPRHHLKRIAKTTRNDRKLASVVSKQL